MIAVFGVSSFVGVKKLTSLNKKTEINIRREMKKKVDEELGR